VDHRVIGERSDAVLQTAMPGDDDCGCCDSTRHLDSRFDFQTATSKFHAPTPMRSCANKSAGWALAPLDKRARGLPRSRPHKMRGDGAPPGATSLSSLDRSPLAKAANKRAHRLAALHRRCVRTPRKKLARTVTLSLPDVWLRTTRAGATLHSTSRTPLEAPLMSETIGI
jgi:hypothetical protein